MIRRFSHTELEQIAGRFGELDGRLRYGTEAEAAADSSVSRRNRDGRHEVGQHAVNAMPAGYELADFLHGLASGADARL
jgi:hypothetical protein